MCIQNGHPNSGVMEIGPGKTGCRRTTLMPMVVKDKDNWGIQMMVGDKDNRID